MRKASKPEPPACENWRERDGRLVRCGAPPVYRVHFADGMSATVCEACRPVEFHLAVELGLVTP